MTWTFVPRARPRRVHRRDSLAAADRRRARGSRRRRGGRKGRVISPAHSEASILRPRRAILRRRPRRASRRTASVAVRSERRRIRARRCSSRAGAVAGAANRQTPPRPAAASQPLPPHGGARARARASRTGCTPRPFASVGPRDVGGRGGEDVTSARRRRRARRRDAVRGRDGAPLAEADRGVFFGEARARVAGKRTSARASGRRADERGAVSASGGHVLYLARRFRGKGLYELD